MQSKTKIVLASLLKPVDDPRMFEKFGKSIAATGRYDVHIAGFYARGKLPSHPDIHFHPLFRFRRISLKRITAPLKFYIFVLKVKPKLIIANSHDLLIVTVIYKILFGTKIFYDIQENYYLNILHTNAFPLFFRPLIAILTRIKETICAPFFDHFFLAEKVYVEQLPFLSKRISVLENRYSPVMPLPLRQRIKITPGKTLKLLYTGTIAEHYGIREAIDLTNNISNFHPVKLLIIGRCAKTGFLQQLKGELSKYPHIMLQASDEPVGHLDIIGAIQSSDLAIVAYRENKSIQGRVPTKIFEYMANNLPFIALNNYKWLDLALKYRACIVSKDKKETKSLLDDIFKTSFYGDMPVDELLWENEEAKLLKILQIFS